MFAFATWIGGNKYDVLIWSSEAESVNDDGAKAIARKTVTIAGDNPTEEIRAAMGLDENAEIELN